MDCQLSRVLSVRFKKKSLKHWLRVVPKFKLNGAKTFMSLESGISNGRRSAKDPRASVNGSGQMFECTSRRTNQSEVDLNLRKHADLLNLLTQVTN